MPTLTHAPTPAPSITTRATRVALGLTMANTAFIPVGAWLAACRVDMSDPSFVPLLALGLGVAGAVILTADHVRATWPQTVAPAPAVAQALADHRDLVRRLRPRTPTPTP